ncbi:hypothetical protein VTJ49DRAFT_3219 [Mycothermus thermophilus]|uniref:RING-type domain-containing protein n=1 Tax=Humicola insolens TaxID=85995 RepID=A0ABR3VMI0_HUMIN
MKLLGLLDFSMARKLSTSDGFENMAPDFLLNPADGLGPDEQDDEIARCEDAVRDCFPDICPDFLNDQGHLHLWDSHAVISAILDDIEKGKSYPKRESKLKRKRDEEKEFEKVEEDPEEAARKKFAAMDPRLASKDRIYVISYIQTAKTLLKDEFPQLYANHVETVLKQHDYKIYPAYLELDKATWDPAAAPAQVKKGRGSGRRSTQAAGAARVSQMEPDKDAVAAFEAARKECRAKAEVRNAKELEKKLAEEAERANFERAKAEGTVAECGCCFDELALNRMVHCDASGTVHWFCLECAKKMAEHVIGNSQYILRCMAMDGCEATFARDQRDRFLDDKMTKALDKIEQEAVIRMAGIENLVQCPFCDYAAEYPPVEENKEFKCENPDCCIISCRLCRDETHIPQTCKEAASERGVSARRLIEEAMSAALIRKCNKCGTPFIKENGCNKMRCTRSGCGNTQCYVCSKSCDYSHFDDPSRGGRRGNCPLFDSVEDRHRDEVNRAEEEARKKVVESNPSVDVEMLKIQFSDKVKEDEERRKGPPNVYPPIEHFDRRPFGFADYQPRAATPGQSPQGQGRENPNAQLPQVQPVQQPPLAARAGLLVQARPLEGPQPQVQPLDMRRQLQPAPILPQALAAAGPAPTLHPSVNAAVTLPRVSGPADNNSFAVLNPPNDRKLPHPEREKVVAPADAPAPADAAAIPIRPAQLPTAQQSPFARFRQNLAAAVASRPEPGQPAAAAPAPAVPSAFYRPFQPLPAQPPISAAAGPAQQPGGHARQVPLLFPFPSPPQVPPVADFLQQIQAQDLFLSDITAKVNQLSNNIAAAQASLGLDPTPQPVAPLPGVIHTPPAPAPAPAPGGGLNGPHPRLPPVQLPPLPPSPHPQGILQAMQQRQIWLAREMARQNLLQTEQKIREVKQRRVELLRKQQQLMRHLPVELWTDEQRRMQLLFQE